MDDNGVGRSLLRQDSRKGGSIGLLDKLRVPKATPGPIQPIVTHTDRVEMRSYLQFPMSAH